jgi:hypothetical protein
MDLANLWEWAGLSFGKDEIFVLLVSLKKLTDEKPLKSVRLWGKIFGTQKNYIVVEAELKDGIVDEEDTVVNPKPEIPIPIPAAEEESAPPANPEQDETDAPKPKHKAVASLPIENRAGVNKYVYYVCNYGMFDDCLSICFKVFNSNFGEKLAEHGRDFLMSSPRSFRHLAKFESSSPEISLVRYEWKENCNPSKHLTLAHRL